MVTKGNPEFSGQLVDILNSNREFLTLKLRFSRSDRIVRRGKGDSMTKSSNPEGENTRR